MKPLNNDGDDATGGADDPGSDATSGTVGTGNEDRLAMMDRINDENDKEQADQLADVNDDGTTAPFTLPEPGNDDPDAVLVPPVVLAPVAPTPVQKIKVDGQEIDLTPELIAKAQKIANADKYLEEAATARKTATTPVPIEVLTPVTPKEDAEAARLENNRALVRAIQMGTEEEAMVALDKVAGRGPGINADDIARIADERLSFNTAIEWFNGEYKDLMGDPVLSNIVMERDDSLVKAGDKRGYKERYKAVGDEVREWMTERAKQFNPTPVPVVVADPLKEKEDRKAALPKTPVAASGKSKPTAIEEDDDDTPAQTIAKMRESRGGPQWSRA